MSQLRKTKNNYEFLVQVSKNTPVPPAPRRRSTANASGH